MKQNTEHRSTAMRLALVGAALDAVDRGHVTSIVFAVARRSCRGAGLIPVKAHWSVTRRKGR